MEERRHKEQEAKLKRISRQRKYEMKYGHPYGEEETAPTDVHQEGPHAYDPYNISQKEKLRRSDDERFDLDVGTHAPLYHPRSAPAELQATQDPAIFGRPSAATNPHLQEPREDIEAEIQRTEERLLALQKKRQAELKKAAPVEAQKEPAQAPKKAPAVPVPGQGATKPKPEVVSPKNKATPQMFLDTTVTKFLDTTVTKFLENDISVTKFLSQASPETVNKFLDTTVTKFLAENDVSVTKFLEQKADDISVTKFLNEYVVTNFLETASPHEHLEQNVIQMLGTSTARFLESNDVSVTKFLEQAIGAMLLDDEAVGQFLEEQNDISVTKFLDAPQNQNDITVTKFLNQNTNDITVTKFLNNQSNDVTVTKFLDAPQNQNDITVTKFLDNPQSNDVTVTKFLDIENYLQ